MTGAETEALDVRIKGRIQGVGFRPFIYRLASRYKIKGWVNNQTSHVKIHIEGSKESNRLFVRDIRLKAPPVSSIDSLETSAAPFQKYRDFSIIPSVDSSDSVTEISPDIALCKECLEDIKSGSRRKDYAFTNCTNCGPRFTIIEDLPYDRPKTTMKNFIMCPQCLGEYKDPGNRRFHAQPNSCELCGPVYKMTTPTDETDDIKIILEESTKILCNGGILAVKGIGGFHLACSPFIDDAVSRLRSIKNRDQKPFAVMFASVNEIKKYAEISAVEEESLKSSGAPIVILKLRKETLLSSVITSGLNSVGCFLPYTPFHHMILQNSAVSAMVLTSGNISSTPIETDNKSALKKFLPLCDAVLTYNREIKNRTDDSVVKIINGRERVFRRSRGWAPESVPVNINVEGIAAAGGEQKNCFCVGRDNRAILSQHIGDIRNIETLEFYKESFNRYSDLYRLSPSLIAQDLHPDYMTTRFFADYDLPKTEIQHHYAHIASCMAENGFCSL
ncbi:MAG: carbamoyltransferase HypF [Spirochaetales bacterium]|nr:carbamoyltransferase HypF [Spirochaetales bacterium]